MPPQCVQGLINPFISSYEPSSRKPLCRRSQTHIPATPVQGFHKHTCILDLYSGTKILHAKPHIRLSVQYRAWASGFSAALYFGVKISDPAPGFSPILDFTEDLWAMEAYGSRV